MCGIAGYIASGGPKVDKAVLKEMADAIAHRGPDGDHYWLDNESCIGFAHRRLSIIDLSNLGDQPMHYMDRYVLIFNGEIYNYIELKERLLSKGYKFNSESDTEVLLALYDDKKEKCLDELDGMFAFALYDIHEKKVFLARDRFGEKPFYYCFHNKVLYFASEMKSFWAAGVPKTTNGEMLYNYLASGFLENPFDKKQTFYSNIYRLPAAHFSTFTIDNLSVEPKRYWSIDLNIQNHSIDLNTAQQTFKELFFTSVNRRLRSDVPLGSSLSGGLDSSLVVSVMDQMDREKNIERKTFSAQFPHFRKDESRYQHLVIEHTHVEPHFVYPSEQSILANLDKVIYHQEEPFGSASINIQYEVFELAKKNGVTVLLDGQGADEVLAGYHYYYSTFFSSLKRNNKKLHTTEWKAYQELHLTNEINTILRNDWTQKMKELIPRSVKNTLKSTVFNGSAREIWRPEFLKAHGCSFKNLREFDDLRSHLYFDITYSGLEILLRYADRNSMAHSREVRLPFLYHKLVEFLFSLPDNYKIRNGWTKWIMRSSFQDLLPKEIAWRKDKIGYEAPQEKWMENKCMKEQVMEAVKKFDKEKILNAKKVEKLNREDVNWKIFVSAKTLYSL
jgi:asparagine synthase (glutamine-hydrolysing)